MTNIQKYIESRIRREYSVFIFANGENIGAAQLPNF